MTELTTSRADRLPEIRPINFDRPWEWLAAGWRDVLKSPHISLTYGAFYALIGCLLTYVLARFGLWYAILPLASGFLLLGPVLAVGLYEVSRRHAAGEPVTFGAVLGAWRRSRHALLYLGVMLMLAGLLWLYVAMLLFALFYGVSGISADTFIAQSFFSSATIWFLLVGVAVGALFATVVFSISAIALPLVIDCPQASATFAVLTSLKAVRGNWWPMMLWAGLIVAFSIAGVAVIYVGLVVTLPLIGHASFHAYRDLVRK